MLNQQDHPAAWAMLMHELDDAHEHLADLIKCMADTGSIDDEDFRIDLGHVFAHLNRAWHGRSDPNLADLSDESHQLRSQFPEDLAPVG